jgi:acetyl esterase/lipase
MLTETQQAAEHPEGYLKPEPTGIIQLWPGEPPNLVDGGKAEIIENERHKNVSRPQLYVYLPPKEKRCGVSLIICAGGGYTRLSMGIHVENVVRILNDQGIAVFGLKYRTRYGENDVVADALADGKRAVRLVRSRAAEWGLDPQRIGVQGYSAGGNLGLNLISYSDNGSAQDSDPVERFSCRPDFCVLMSTWPAQIKHIEDLPLTRNVPPTWIAIARDDATAPPAFSQAIADRLEKLQVRHELYIVEKGGHGAFHYGLSSSEGGQWPTLLLAWLHAIGIMTDRR